MSDHGGRIAGRLLRFIPQRVAETPERVVLNGSCAVIGLSALIRGQEALWPLWVGYAWSALMLLGGVAALVGYLGGHLALERAGYLALLVATAAFAVVLLYAYGWLVLPTAVIFLGIAVSKSLRLLVTSAARSALLRNGEARASEGDL